MKNTLTRADWIEWGNQTLIYCVLPTAIVFLTTLQTGDYRTAIGSAYTALISSIINLLRKHAAGSDVPPTVVQPELP